MNGLLKLYYIIFVFYFFGGITSIFNFPSITPDVLAVGFIFLSATEDRFELRIPRKEGIYFFGTVIVPAVLIFVYSISMNLLNSLTTDYMVTTTMTCMRLVLYTFVGVRAIYSFGKKAIDLLLISCVIAYIPDVFKFFIEEGIVNGIMILTSSNAYLSTSSLEVHRLTYVFGFLTVYYFYKWFVNKEKVLKQMIIAFICSALGLKRIVVIALAIIVLVVVLFKLLKEKKSYKLAIGISVFMVLFSLVYIYAIREGIVQSAFSFLNIEDNFRFRFWEHIEHKYRFSPSYLGYGVSYVRTFMMHEWDNIKDLSAATHIHNDVLAYYIGLGFWGFIAFFGMFFLGQIGLAKKYFSKDVAIFVFVLSLFYYIIMSFCNEGLPGIVYGLYVTVIFSAIKYQQDEKDVIDGEYELAEE